MTIFYTKSGHISSIRTPFSGGYMTTYPGNPFRGGVTFKSGKFTTRMSGGRVTGTGFKSGSSTTYFRNNRLSDRLTPF